MPRFNLRRLFFERDVLSLMGFGLLVKPIGLVTQVLLARWFGADERMDAYQLAFFLITLGNGTLSRVFKGALSPHLIQRKREMATPAYARYQNGLVGILLVVGSLWFLCVVLLGRPLIDFVWPGLPDLTRDLTVQMLLVMALPGLLMMMNNLSIVVLNLHQFFRLAGAMPVLNALAMLLALWIWHERLGIWALPAGFGLAQLLKWPILHGWALFVGALRRVRPSLAGSDMGHLRDLVMLMAISEVLLTVNLFLDRWFATGLEAGSISSLHYSFTITNTVLVLFATSLVTVMFPRMSAAIAAGDFAGCSRDIRTNLLRTAHLIVPGAIMVAVASDEIVRVLFQRGEFDAADAMRTSGTMAMYALGLPALVINGLVARVFHSLQLLRDKVWLSVQFLVTNAALNMLLIGPLKVQGLALASTVAIMLHLALSLWMLHRKRTGLTTGAFSRIVGEAFLLGLATMGAYLLLPIDEFLAGSLGSGFWHAVAGGAVKAAAIVVIYGILWLVWRRRLRRGA